MSESSDSFGMAQIKFVDGDNAPTTFDVMFNPKELSIDNSESDAPIMEFTAAEPQTMNFELMFDTFETKANVKEAFVDTLIKMCKVDSKLKRPPMVRFTYAHVDFKGVITSVKTKYTLFLANGTPVRATCTLALTEADQALNKDQSKALKEASKKKKKGTTTQSGTAGRIDNVSAANGSTPRATGEKNNLDSLNNVPPGTNLKT